MRRLGATPASDGCEFLVWAPRASAVAVRLCGRTGPPVDLAPCGKGYFRGEIPGVGPGDRYLYRLDGDRDLPDPASRCQPDGVHGASEVVDPDSSRGGSWSGMPLRRYVFYELHVGAFTPEGTFDAVIGHLPRLKRLGITAIELMPVAQFPGRRNWGYDGVGLFAPQSSYGGPDGLRRLVDACHREGLAAVLDVVYNHVGPEGNYLDAFGPYFTDRYRTPWGRGLNLDGSGSDEVRRFFIESATQWISDFRFDALRLDAVHAIVDPSARPFLEELTDAVHREGARLGRPAYVIAESDANDPRLVTGRERGGCAMDAMWNDDFHHALHALLTGERRGYYRDFGAVSQLGRAYARTFVFAGEPSSYRGRRHGRRGAEDVPAERFVVFDQNHDQVGNRMLGERLATLVDFERLKLAAGAALTSPYLPLLFMGEEYGETAPFLYFVDHGDPELVEAVRKGRRAEFAEFSWNGDAPDPQDEATFLSSRLDHGLADREPHRALRAFYRELLRLRRRLPPLSRRRREGLRVHCDEETATLAVLREGRGRLSLCVLRFAGNAAARPVPVPAPEGVFRTVLDSADPRWGGPGRSVPLELRSGPEGLLLPAHGPVFLMLEQEGAR
jgi:maltooligosyltrehalose trehalohydrolase